MLFFAFLLYLAPANKLLSLVKLPRTISVYTVNGNLWHGKIDAVEANSVRVSNISWNLGLLTLIFAKGVVINIDDPNLAKGSFDLKIFGLDKEIALSSVELEADLNRVVTMAKLPLPIPVKASGLITTDLSSVVFDKNGNFKNAKGTITIKDTSVVYTFDKENTVNLGVVKIDVAKLAGRANAFQFNINQDSELLQTSDLKVIVEDYSKVSVTGSIRIRGTLPPSLATALNMVGTPDAEGNINIDYNSEQ